MSEWDDEQKDRCVNNLMRIAAGMNGIAQVHICVTDDDGSNHFYAYGKPPMSNVTILGLLDAAHMVAAADFEAQKIDGPLGED